MGPKYSGDLQGSLPLGTCHCPVGGGPSMRKLTWGPRHYAGSSGEWQALSTPPPHESGSPSPAGTISPDMNHSLPGFHRKHQRASSSEFQEFMRALGSSGRASWPGPSAPPLALTVPGSPCKTEEGNTLTGSKDRHIQLPLSPMAQELLPTQTSPNPPCSSSIQPFIAPRSLLYSPP